MKAKLRLIVLAIGLGLAAGLIGRIAKAQYMVGETVPQSQAVLDSYFSSNSIPGQQQYWEWIDTMFYYVAATFTNSQAAAQSASIAQAAAQTQVATVYLWFSGGTAANAKAVIYQSTGFSSNVVAGYLNVPSSFSFAYYTNYFMVPLAQSPPPFYAVWSIPYGGGLASSETAFQPLTGPDNSGSVTVTTNTVVLYLQGQATTTNLFYIAIYQ